MKKNNEAKFYLAGRWTEGDELRPSGNPFKQNEPIRNVHLAKPEHISEAYRAAVKSGALWRDLACEERTNFLVGAFDIVYENRYDIAELISAEQGKTITEAMALEVIPSLDMLRYYAVKAPLFLEPDKISFHQPYFHTKESRVVFSPLGVVAILTSGYNPWISPLTATVLALVAGNAVLLKPSLKTALCGLKIAELFDSLGLPEGLLSVLTGGDLVGRMVASQPVQAVTFIGDRSSGLRTSQECIEAFKKHILECGGNNPLIVLDDANLDTATSAALWGAFSNNGQTHGSMDRVLLQEGIADRFIELLLQKFAALKLGDPTDPETDIGPMIDTEPHALLDKLIRDAKSAGAEVLAKKEVEKGLSENFYGPVILGNVNSSMHICREPFYGPVMTIQRFKRDEDALNLANKTIYGLSASVWGRDVERLSSVVSHMDYGNVWVNDVMFPYEAPQSPWAGTKQSGHGQLHSPYGLLEYVFLKHVGYDSFDHPSKDYYFPYDNSLRSYIDFIADSVKSNNPVSRFLNRIRFREMTKLRHPPKD